MASFHWQHVLDITFGRMIQYSGFDKNEKTGDHGNKREIQYDGICLDISTCIRIEIKRDKATY